LRAKPTCQERSQQKRDRILAAMDALLRTRPFPDIGVADLARRARVSPATLYQRFSNIDATASVLLELYYRRVEEWATRPKKAVLPRDAPLFDALQRVAADAYDQVDALGHILRPAYLYSRQHPERVGADWRRLGDIAQRGFRAFLRGRASQLRVDDVDRSADILCYVFNLLLLGPLLHAGDRLSSPVRNRKEFSETLATLACGYLTFPSAAGT
jgi:AcrR family transcriptional regulator